MKDITNVKKTSKPQLRLQLQGHPNIWYQGEELTALRAVKARALLYFLIVEYHVNGQASFPKEQLADLLWPGMPIPSALQNLRQTVYRIRKTVPTATPGASLLLTDRQQVALNKQVDLTSDLSWLANNEMGEVPDIAVENALAQLSPPLLEHFSVPDASGFDEWVDSMRERLRRSKAERLQALVRRYAHQPEAALPFAEHRVQLLPYDESSMLEYLQLLQRAGKHHQAKRSYQLFAEKLQRDLGQAPTAALARWPTASQPAVPRAKPVQNGAPPAPKSTLGKYGVLAGALLLLAFWLGSRFLPQRPAPESWRIAVLPFDNQTDNAFLADGLTDELIIALSKVDGITTISRQASARYKGTDKSLQQIGEELNVPYLLKGALSEQEGGWYVRVELAAVEDGHLVWSDGFRQKEEKVFLFQQSISREVIRNLTGSLDLTGAYLVRPPTENYQAYNAYLEGRNLSYFAHPDSLEKAVTFFKKATALDPDFSLAYNELAKVYCTMAGSWGNKRIEEVYPQIRGALDAIVGDPKLESAYYHNLGWLSFWMLDIQQAESYLRRSLSIDNKEEYAIGGLAMILCLQGRYEASEALAKQGLVDNPHLFWNYFALAQTHYYAGEWDKAAAALEKGLGLYGGHAASIGLRANMYTLQGQPGQAIEYLRSVQDEPVEQWGSNLLGFLGLAYLAQGEHGRAMELCQTLETRHRAGEKYCARNAAKLYAAAGRPNQAIRLLEEALEQRDNELNWIGVDYAFRPLHNEPRFQQILRALGLEGVMR